MGSGSEPAGLMTMSEAASELRVSEKTIARMIRRKELRAVRVGRSVRVPSGEVQRLTAAAAGGG